MKKPIIFLASILFIATLFTSCGDDSEQENNPPEENGDCMEYTDLTTYFPNSLIYVQFINDSEGWAVGKSEENNRVLIKTEDSGTTWQVINNDINTNFGNVPSPRMQFINSTDGFSIDKYIYTNNVGYTTSYTTDKGATWTTYTNPTPEPARFSLGAWTAIASNSTKTVILNNVHMTLVIDNATKNIIQTVAMDETLEQTSKHIFDEAHLSESGVLTCVMYWTNGLYKVAQTSDYGLTWSYRHDMDLDHIQTMSWANDNVGYIKGTIGATDGHIYKTTDGGLTWVRNDCPDFTTMDFADENNGLGMDMFHAYKTTDGANTWAKICDEEDDGTSGYVSYPSVNNGWFIGYNNTQYQGRGLFNYKGE